MDKIQNFQRWPLDRVVAMLRQRYPASCVNIAEDCSEQAVLHLDHFTITITNQGKIEVAAPTHSHRRVEQMAIEIERLLRLASVHHQEQVDS